MPIKGYGGESFGRVSSTPLPPGIRIIGSKIAQMTKIGIDSGKAIAHP